MYYLHVCLVFKVIFTVLADCANLMVVHVLLWIKILAKSKLTQIWWVVHVIPVCKAIFTFLADCAKLMVVHVLLWVLILGQTKLFNLLYGLLAYVLIFQVYFIIETWVVHVLLWILILGQSKLFIFSLWIELVVHVLPLVVSLFSRLSSLFWLIMPNWW